MILRETSLKKCRHRCCLHNCLSTTSTNTLVQSLHSLRTMKSSLYDYFNSSNSSSSSSSSSSIPPRHHSINKKGGGYLGSLRGSAFSAYSRPNHQTRDAHSYRNAVPAPKPVQTKSAKFENTSSVDTTMVTLSNLDLTGTSSLLHTLRGLGTREARSGRMAAFHPLS